MDRHVILTLGRSGSNTLRDMINQHPEAFNLGEVLGHWTPFRRLQRARLLPADDEAYLDTLLYSDRFARRAMALQRVHATLRGHRDGAKSGARVRTFGVKDFSLNFLRCGLGKYLATRDTKVIGLKRLSVPARMLSNAMLGATGVVSVQGGSAVRKRISIDPAQIGDMLATIERENADLDTMLATLPEDRCRVICYEDLFGEAGHRQDLMGKVFRFLGLHPIDVTTRMTKIIATPIDETIVNFADCLKAVEGTRYERMLREEARSRPQ